MASVLVVDDEEDIRELVGIYIKMRAIRYIRRLMEKMLLILLIT